MIEATEAIMHSIEILRVCPWFDVFFSLFKHKTGSVRQILLRDGPFQGVLPPLIGGCCPGHPVSLKKKVNGRRLNLTKYYVCYKN